MAINLLPGDLSPKGPVVKIAALVRSVSVISFSILLIAGLGISAFFVLNTLQIRSLNSQTEELKNSIKSLEQTEQGMVLVRDRLIKVKQVLGQESGKDEVDGLANLVSGVGTSAELAETLVSRDSAEVTFIAVSSSTLTQLMASIVTQDSFKNVELMSFSFNPNAGYVVSLVLKTK